MKKTFLAILSLFVLFGVSSLNLKQEQVSRSFEKTVFVEIDSKNDSTLFLPYSKAWLEPWNFNDPVLRCYGSGVMNTENYLSAFNGRNDNLWTILHPKIINGTLTLYSPYNPMSFSIHDDGELHYPLKGNGAKDNFLTSQKLRDEICYYLGEYGPSSYYPLVTVYGEDSVRALPDGTLEYVYPARDYNWYTDKEIVKYKVRIKVLIKKNGVEKKRVVEAIAPIVLEIDDGQITGERELLWLDYNEVKPYLKEGYFFDDRGKPITYLKYFDEKVKVGN